MLEKAASGPCFGCYLVSLSQSLPPPPAPCTLNYKTFLWSYFRGSFIKGRQWLEQPRGSRTQLIKMSLAGFNCVFRPFNLLPPFPCFQLIVRFLQLPPQPPIITASLRLVYCFYIISFLGLPSRRRANQVVFINRLDYFGNLQISFYNPRS